ncbi:aldehyde dehydrogenase family 3 member H1-like isoform X2 [Cucurbita pepo subsp. pepo]|uniref:aldehyde dehydrogenase family 3 member H1-like isoform X2 n=1 Tax=Cucurbita pepo subsp. pepo TaxID=3664 RepID=UPI000C9D5022|nr:aldehyde dehydrogenase family 3 member H1-like isoform X2 [Cucurbita pepo subsp. pepo]
MAEERAVFDCEAAERVVAEVRECYNSGKTRRYEWRVEQVKNLLKLVDENQKEMIDTVHSDFSKPEFEAFAHEIALLKNSCKLALKELRRWMTPEKVKTSITTFPSSAAIVPEPLGVVLIISAWNYPFLLSLDPVVGAIAAGNAVVLKPSEISPATSSLMAKLLGKYLDTSAIKVIEGATSETSALLEQKWDKIFYTGSGRVGRIVMAAAAKHLTPVVLELGGKSPVVVDTQINLQVACRRIIAGKWGCNNGQACIAPDYIITTKEFAPKLVETLKQELERFYGKNPMETKDLSRIVNANHFARLSKLLDDDKVSGKIVHGGERDKAKLQITPTLLLDVPRDSLIMTEEIFGPLLPILTVDKVEDSFEVVNSGTKPLAAYLFTNNKRLKDQFVACISAGGVAINDTTLHLTVSTLPFGGVGDSGMGSYHGKFSFDAFSHKKAVLYRSFAGDAPMRYPPYTKGKLRILKALLGGDIWGLIRALFGWS